VRYDVVVESAKMGCDLARHESMLAAGADQDGLVEFKYEELH
jgi:hypothetical protein